MNTVARSEQSSKSVTAKELATAKIQKMYLDGKWTKIKKKKIEYLRQMARNMYSCFILIFFRNYSEDYYGDLDLKSIRKSELLAGYSDTHKQVQPKARNPVADKA